MGQTEKNSARSAVGTVIADSPASVAFCNGRSRVEFRYASFSDRVSVAAQYVAKGAINGLMHRSKQHAWLHAFSIAARGRTLKQSRAFESRAERGR
jgi:hypothetical protein